MVSSWILQKEEEEELTVFGWQLAV
jgi:hypothetical protein